MTAKLLKAYGSADPPSPSTSGELRLLVCPGRSQTLSIREKDFVSAAKVSGESSPRIIFREILPNMTSIVAASMLARITLVGDDPVIYDHLGDIYATQQRLSDAREAWLHALELDPTNLKLMDRFREQGMGDPAQEERIQQAKRRVAGQKPSLPIAQ